MHSLPKQPLSLKLNLPDLEPSTAKGSGLSLETESLKLDSIDPTLTSATLPPLNKTKTPNLKTAEPDKFTDISNPKIDAADHQAPAPLTLEASAKQLKQIVPEAPTVPTLWRPGGLNASLTASLIANNDLTLKKPELNALAAAPKLSLIDEASAKLTLSPEIAPQADTALIDFLLGRGDLNYSASQYANAKTSFSLGIEKLDLDLDLDLDSTSSRNNKAIASNTEEDLIWGDWEYKESDYTVRDYFAEHQAAAKKKASKKSNNAPTESHHHIETESAEPTVAHSAKITLENSTSDPAQDVANIIAEATKGITTEAEKKEKVEPVVTKELASVAAPKVKEKYKSNINVIKRSRPAKTRTLSSQAIVTPNVVAESSSVSAPAEATIAIQYSTNPIQLAQSLFIPAAEPLSSVVSNAAQQTISGATVASALDQAVAVELLEQTPATTDYISPRTSSPLDILSTPVEQSVSYPQNSGLLSGPFLMAYANQEAAQDFHRNPGVRTLYLRSLRFNNEQRPTQRTAELPQENFVFITAGMFTAPHAKQTAGGIADNIRSSEISKGYSHELYTASGKSNPQGGQDGNSDHQEQQLFVPDNNGKQKISKKSNQTYQNPTELRFQLPQVDIITV
ncbi:hypothetical protein BVY03_03650 [bacterium K02(2017)]|nr:hypothetical protein BVY03_03650 [bacterium K02(2017)]